MPDYAPLKARLAQSDMTALPDDPSRLTALNAPGAPANAPVPVWMAREWGASTGVRKAIQAAASDASRTSNAIALTMLDVLQDSASPPIDPTSPGIQAMIAALVADGVMTSAQAASFAAANAQPGPSIAAGLGFPGGVTAADFSYARSLPS